MKIVKINQLKLSFLQPFSSCFRNESYLPLRDKHFPHKLILYNGRTVLATLAPSFLIVSYQVHF